MNSYSKIWVKNTAAKALTHIAKEMTNGNGRNAELIGHLETISVIILMTKFAVGETLNLSSEELKSLVFGLTAEDM